VSGALSAHTDSATIYLEGFSFILLLLLSGASILHLLSGLFPNRFPHFRFSRRSPAPTQNGKLAYNSAGYGSARYKNYRPQHHSAGNIQWGTFLLSGMYPCPAALLVLVLVSTLDAAGIGMNGNSHHRCGIPCVDGTAAVVYTDRQNPKICRNCCIGTRANRLRRYLYLFAYGGTAFHQKRDRVTQWTT